MNDTENLLSIGKNIENLINHAVTKIFNSHKDTFAIKDENYIIHAVWGAVKDGELDAVQKMIHKDVNQLAENVISTLDIKDMTHPQRFAIRSLVNRVIIYHIAFINETASKAVDQKNMPDSGVLIN